MTTKIDSIKKQLIHDITHSKFCDAWFYEEHLLVVEKLAMALCEYYPKANREAVNLMVWFHDIGRAHNANRDHDLYGAEYAQKILTANSFTRSSSLPLNNSIRFILSSMSSSCSYIEIHKSRLFKNIVVNFSNPN